MNLTGNLPLQNRKTGRLVKQPVLEGVVVSTLMSASPASAFNTALAFIFKPDVARLPLAYNINYSLCVTTICFPLR